jgi:hypothetical protein
MIRTGLELNEWRTCANRTIYVSVTDQPLYQRAQELARLGNPLSGAEISTRSQALRVEVRGRLASRLRRKSPTKVAVSARGHKVRLQTHVLASVEWISSDGREVIVH